MYEEQLCFAYRERHGIRATLVRFFGGYGPRQNLTWWGGPQSVFISQALRNEPMEVHGDGSQTRSFTYIADHIDGLVALLDNEKVDGRVLNFGAAEEIAIVDLAKLIWRLIRTDEPKIKFVPYSTFGKYQDVMRRVPDTTKCRELCAVEFRTTLKDGMAKTIAWQKQVLGL
jgi:UDP-glucose 4-epimerase